MDKRPLFISTFCCIGRPLSDALDTLTRHTSHIEILSDGLHDIRRNPGLCREYPATWSVHAPSSEINIAAVSERIRKASVEELGEVLSACNRIGAEHLVVHPGYSAYEEVREPSFVSLKKSLDELVYLQEEHGTRVCIENMGAWECCHFRTPAFLPELTSRGLGCTLDCGHAMLNGNLDEFLATGGFCHIHLHDNHGTSDDHLACGEGTTDFGTIWKKVPLHASLVIETRELAAAGRSLEFLASLMDNEE